MFGLSRFWYCMNWMCRNVIWFVYNNCFETVAHFIPRRKMKRIHKIHQIVWLNYGKILSSVHILFIFIIEIKLLHMELFTEEWPFRLICYAAFHAAFHCIRSKSYIKFNWHFAKCCLVVFWSYVHILFFFWNLWETYHSHIQKRNLQFPFLFCILCSKKWKRMGAVEQTQKKTLPKWDESIACVTFHFPLERVPLAT